MRDITARLLMHGQEAQTLGGPSVRVPATARALRDLGIQAQASSFTSAAEISEDLVHLFNVWPPNSALAALKALKAAGKTVVFSPIFLDFTERDFWEYDLPGLAHAAPDQLRKALQRGRLHAKTRDRFHEPVPGFHAAVREMVALADHLVLLSPHEGEALRAIGAKVDAARTSLVLNPVDTEAWTTGDPQRFYDAVLAPRGGVQDYIVTIGRIEPRKNQLMLARAIKGLPLRLVVVGHAADQAYTAKLREMAGDQLLEVGRLPPGGEMLRSILAGARAFALPSWCEGAPLAALEAASMGTGLVLSDQGALRHYFGDLASYADPGDPEAIGRAVEEVLATETPARGPALRDLVQRRNSLESYARATAQSYRLALDNPRPQRAAKALSAQAIADLATTDMTPADWAAADLASAPQRRLILDVTGLSEQTPGPDAALSLRLACAILEASEKENGGEDGGATKPPQLLALINGQPCLLRPDPLRKSGLQRPETSDLALDPGGVILSLSPLLAQGAGHLAALRDLAEATGAQLAALVPSGAALGAPHRLPPETLAAIHRDLLRWTGCCSALLSWSDEDAQALTGLLQAAGRDLLPVVVLPDLPLSPKDGTFEHGVLEGAAFEEGALEERSGDADLSAAGPQQAGLRTKVLPAGRTDDAAQVTQSALAQAEALEGTSEEASSETEIAGEGISEAASPEGSFATPSEADPRAEDHAEDLPENLSEDLAGDFAEDLSAAPDAAPNETPDETPEGCALAQDAAAAAPIPAPPAARVPASSPAVRPAPLPLPEEPFVLAPEAFGPGQEPELLYRLWRDLADAPQAEGMVLCWTGDTDPDCAPLLRRLLADPKTRHRLRHLGTPGAGDLARAAQASRLLITASLDSTGTPLRRLAQGLGLPCLTLTGRDDVAAFLAAARLDPCDGARSDPLSAPLAAPALPDAAAAALAAALAPLARLGEARPGAARLMGQRAFAGLGQEDTGLSFGAGWAPASPETRWCAAPQADFHLDARAVLHEGVESFGLVLSLAAQGVWEGEVRLTLPSEPQTVVFAARLGAQAFPREIVLELPSRLLSAQGELRLRLELPQDASAGLVSVGLVSAGLFRLDLGNPLGLSEAPQAWALGNSALRVDLSDPAQRQVIAGHLPWHPAWGLGHRSGSFDILLPLLPGAPRQRLVLTGRAVATLADPVRLRISLGTHLGGQELAAARLTDDTPFSLELRLPAEAMAKLGPLVLRLDCDPPQNPAALGLGAHDALAGLGLSALRLLPQGDLA